MDRVPFLLACSSFVSGLYVTLGLTRDLVGSLDSHYTDAKFEFSLSTVLGGGLSFHMHILSCQLPEGKKGPDD